MYSTGIVMYIGLHVQYRDYYVYRSACTVPVLLCISVCMYSTGIVMYIGLHVQYRYCYAYRSACTVPVLLCISVCMQSIHFSCQILKKLELSRHAFQILKHKILLKKIITVEVEMFHADRRTDRHDEADSRYTLPT